METKRGRFQRTHDFTQTQRGVRGELLALRHELEVLDDDMRTGSAPPSARVALDYAFTHLRAAEQAWQRGRRFGDLELIVVQIDASRDALEACVAVRAGRRKTHAGA